MNKVPHTNRPTTAAAIASSRAGPGCVPRFGISPAKAPPTPYRSWCNLRRSLLARVHTHARARQRGTVFCAAVPVHQPGDVRTYSLNILTIRSTDPSRFSLHVVVHRDRQQTSPSHRHHYARLNRRIRSRPWPWRCTHPRTAPRANVPDRSPFSKIRPIVMLSRRYRAHVRVAVPCIPDIGSASW